MYELYLHLTWTFQTN